MPRRPASFDTNKWQSDEGRFHRLVLAESDLTNANLSGANFKNANLSRANLKNANLSISNLRSARLTSDTVYNQWTIFPTGMDPVALGLTLMPSPAGDFNANDELDVADIDMFTARLPNDSMEFIWLHYGMLDLNGDRLVNLEDHGIWVKDLKQTWFGDANLDQEFNSSDLVLVLAAGEYEDELVGNSGLGTPLDADPRLPGDLCSGRRLRSGLEPNGAVPTSFVRDADGGLVHGDPPAIRRSVRAQHRLQRVFSCQQLRGKCINCGNAVKSPFAQRRSAQYCGGRSLRRCGHFDQTQFAVVLRAGGWTNQREFPN